MKGEDYPYRGVQTEQVQREAVESLSWWVSELDQTRLDIPRCHLVLHVPVSDLADAAPTLPR